MVETYSPVGAVIYILRRTASYAEAASYAFGHINLIEKRIDIPADILRPGNHGGDKARPKLITLLVADMVGDFIDQNVQQSVIHCQHLLHQLLFKAEMNIVWHQEMILILCACTVTSEFPHKIF